MLHFRRRPFSIHQWNDSLWTPHVRIGSFQLSINGSHWVCVRSPLPPFLIRDASSNVVHFPRLSSLSLNKRQLRNDSYPLGTGCVAPIIYVQSYLISMKPSIGYSRRTSLPDLNPFSRRAIILYIITTPTLGRSGSNHGHEKISVIRTASTRWNTT